ncbi:MAG: hypothetical protein GC136_10375 [Alphaproteobacteria bacterium]|nr:hypothetical protein [Alphaproteobacteria bacterium]
MLRKLLVAMPALALAFTATTQDSAFAEGGAREIRVTSNNMTSAQLLEQSRTTPLVISFGAEWCGPCHLLTRDINNYLATTDPDPFIYHYIDVDAENGAELSRAFNAPPRVVPHVVVVCGGQIQGRAQGYGPPTGLAIEDALATPACSSITPR